jgi:hypothetical protein
MFPFILALLMRFGDTSLFGTKFEGKSCNQHGTAGVCPPGEREICRSLTSAGCEHVESNNKRASSR